MWELDNKESWEPKNWCFWTVVLEKTLESPKEIKIVNPQGNQIWILIERIDSEAEAPVLLQPDAKNWLIRKDPDAGKDWGQEEKGTTEDEMVGWHHQLDGQEFDQSMVSQRVGHDWASELHTWSTERKMKKEIKKKKGRKKERKRNWGRGKVLFTAGCWRLDYKGLME